ncbi:PEPxxWA-CTERM sorting domain-containing protein [Sphingomonas sp. M1A8_2b]
MRKLTLSLMAALAATVTAAPAAAVTVNFASGVTTTVNNGVIFENFDGATTGAPIGVNTYAYNSNVPGYGKTPNGASGNYAAVLGGGTYTVSLPAFAPVFSFLAGTIDAYNSVTLTLVNTSLASTDIAYKSFQTFTGSQLGTLNGDGRVTFDTGSSTFLISAASFLSSQNSFEIENIASAAPEPGTWAMMILGFGFAGMGLRSRRRAKLALA